MLVDVREICGLGGGPLPNGTINFDPRQSFHPSFTCVFPEIPPVCSLQDDPSFFRFEILLKVVVGLLALFCQFTSLVLASFVLQPEVPESSVPNKVPDSGNLDFWSRKVTLATLNLSHSRAHPRFSGVRKWHDLIRMKSIQLDTIERELEIIKCRNNCVKSEW